jgi:hypothetical protein
VTVSRVIDRQARLLQTNFWSLPTAILAGVFAAILQARSFNELMLRVIGYSALGLSVWLLIVRNVPEKLRLPRALAFFGAFFLGGCLSLFAGDRLHLGTVIWSFLAATLLAVFVWKFWK